MLTKALSRGSVCLNNKVCLNNGVETVSRSRLCQMSQMLTGFTSLRTDPRRMYRQELEQPRLSQLVSTWVCHSTGQGSQIADLIGIQRQTQAGQISYPART
jgi:hypothetical protein